MPTPFDQGPVAPRKSPPFLLAGLLAMLLLGAMAISWFGMKRGAPLAPTDSIDPSAPTPEQFASMVIPGFTLLDQDGAAHSRDIFRDRWTILAFTFTNCPTACPIMNSHLIRLQESLKGTGVRTVSITVDPAHDTPEALRAHADKLGIDTARWMFLTGDERVIRGILAGLRFDVTDDPALPITLPDGTSMNNIIHPTRLLLIGPDAAVHAMESGLDWHGAEALGRLARRQASRDRGDRGSTP